MKKFNITPFFKKEFGEIRVIEKKQRTLVCWERCSKITRL